MPRTKVTAMLRTNATWSPRRIAQTANWQVNDDRISRTVAGPTNGRIARWKAAFVSGLIGGHCGALARALK